MPNDKPTIDSYLSNLEPGTREKLQRIRNLVHQLVPSTVETISYGIPTFTYKSKNLVHMGAFKGHVSLFPGGEATTALSQDLAEYKTSKGTIRFPLNKELPLKLIEKIIVYLLNKRVSP